MGEDASVEVVESRETFKEYPFVPPVMVTAAVVVAVTALPGVKLGRFKIVGVIVKEMV